MNSESEDDANEILFENAFKHDKDEDDDFEESDEYSLNNEEDFVLS